MNKLDLLRAEIDRLDEIIVKSLCQRMQAAELIGQYKHEQGLPIHDEKREKELLLALEAKSMGYEAEIIELYRLILQQSCNRQKNKGQGW